MVTKKQKGLGRGLDALLGPDLGEDLGAVLDDAPSGTGPSALPTVLPLGVLCSGRYQPRQQMDEGALYELAESIRAQGLMQPILVRPLPEAVAVDGQAAPIGATPRYEIIAGERRWRAAALAELTEVPVLIRAVNDQTAAAMALVENMQREDLNPLEEAQGMQRLIREFGLTHEQAAQAVGRSRSAASNLLRLLNLAEPVQALLMAGDLDMGHARALLSLDRATQLTAANQVVARKLSVRETEALTRRLAQTFALVAPRPTAEKSRDVRRVEDELSDLLGASVEVRIKKRVKRGKQVDEQGELAIAFGSLDALQGVIDRLRGPTSEA